MFYFYSLHVSGRHVTIIRINCINATPSICHSDLHTTRSFTQSDI